MDGDAVGVFVTVSAEMMRLVRMSLIGKRGVVERGEGLESKWGWKERIQGLFSRASWCSKSGRRRRRWL